MVIAANTKIAAILKHNPAALEAIVSLSPKFEKLRNPFLRKLMAGRASIAMASKIGGCSINDFFQQLQPLGFEADGTAPVIAEEKEEVPVSSAGNSANNWDEVLATFNNRVQTIDVRQLEMPLPMITILEALDVLPAEHALFVYHKRIPVFLLPELSQRKLDYRIKEVREGEVHLLIF